VPQNRQLGRSDLHEDKMIFVFLFLMLKINISSLNRIYKDFVTFDKLPFFGYGRNSTVRIGYASGL
jgi:hypothetical protein